MSSQDALQLEIIAVNAVTRWWVSAMPQTLVLQNPLSLFFILQLKKQTPRIYVFGIVIWEQYCASLLINLVSQGFGTGVGRC